MKPSKSVDEFEHFIDRRGRSIAGLTVRAGIMEMLVFYEAVLPVGCLVENGDMLLYQWGTYDWGDGMHFEVNITRQFIESSLERDDAISQLQLTFQYPPTLDIVGFGAGSRWCKSRSDTDECRQFVISNPAYCGVADNVPHGATLRHEYV